MVPQARYVSIIDKKDAGAPNSGQIGTQKHDCFDLQSEDGGDLGVRFIFIRELLRSSVEYVPTRKQREDIPTKALVGTAFKAHRGFVINLRVWGSSDFTSVILTTTLHWLILRFSAG